MIVLKKHNLNNTKKVVFDKERGTFTFYLFNHDEDEILDYEDFYKVKICDLTSKTCVEFLSKEDVHKAYDYLSNMIINGELKPGEYYFDIEDPGAKDGEMTLEVEYYGASRMSKLEKRIDILEGEVALYKNVR